MEKIKIINKKKVELDFKKVKSILENNDYTINNCEFILMEIKPYRKNIFLQLYGKGNKFNKTWINYSTEEKFNWIKTDLREKFTKDEFIDHILKSIALFSENKKIIESFILALNIDLLGEINKNG